jgi:hypothetical protein
MPKRLAQRAARPPALKVVLALTVPAPPAAAKLTAPVCPRLLPPTVRTPLLSVPPCASVKLLVPAAVTGEVPLRSWAVLDRVPAPRVPGDGKPASRRAHAEERVAEMSKNREPWTATAVPLHRVSGARRVFLLDAEDL